MRLIVLLSKKVAYVSQVSLTAGCLFCTSACQWMPSLELYVSWIKNGSGSLYVKFDKFSLCSGFINFDVSLLWILNYSSCALMVFIVFLPSLFCFGPLNSLAFLADWGAIWFFQSFITVLLYFYCVFFHISKSSQNCLPRGRI